MLVLSRQRDETIMIGDDIEITVVDIRGDKIRLGIEAPSAIAVHRKEVYEAIRRENEQAARVKVSELDRLRITPTSNSERGTTRGSPPGGRKKGTVRYASTLQARVSRNRKTRTA